jgi:hypothetical protein
MAVPPPPYGKPLMATISDSFVLCAFRGIDSLAELLNFTIPTRDAVSPMKIWSTNSATNWIDFCQLVCPILPDSSMTKHKSVLQSGDNNYDIAVYTEYSMAFSYMLWK